MESTNVNGIKFPLKSMLKQYGPKPHAADSRQTHLRSATTIVVTGLSLAEASVTNQTSIPLRLAALDSRPANLPKKTEVRYVVTNDQWRSVTDPQIIHMAQALRESTNPKKRMPRWLVRAILLIAVIVPLYFFVRKLKHN
jgi:hypothetical protein